MKKWYHINAATWTWHIKSDEITIQSFTQMSQIVIFSFLTVFKMAYTTLTCSSLQLIAFPYFKE